MKQQDSKKQKTSCSYMIYTIGGVDVSFEVIGVPEVLQQAIHSTSFEGESIVSIWETAASILPNNVVLSECTVKGINAYRDIFPGS